MFKLFKVKEVRKPVSFDEALSVISQTLASQEEVSEHPKNVARMFKELASIEGFSDYLKMTLTKDISRYFMATNDEERGIIRGAFARTSYLLSRLKDSRLDKIM